MKSVLYCGCTVNAYMPFHGESTFSLSLLARISLFRHGRSLSLSDSSRSTSLFARYLARWPPAQPMKARGGELLRRSYGVAGVAEGLGLLPPQRSYCFSHPNHPPGNHPGRATISLRRLLPPGPSLRTAVPLYPRVYFLLVVRLPLHPSSAPRARERPTASYGTVLRILMDRLRNCWRN